MDRGVGTNDPARLHLRPIRHGSGHQRGEVAAAAANVQGSSPRSQVASQQLQADGVHVRGADGGPEPGGDGRAPPPAVDWRSGLLCWPNCIKPARAAKFDLAQVCCDL